MNSTDVLTIAIPVYERFDYFPQAVESVLSQTIVPKIIVVDNASSHNKFKQYCAANSIRYYHNDQNVGMFANWNKCFEYSNTEYVMILGDDDLLENNYVELFLNCLSIHKKIDVFFADFKILQYPIKNITNHMHTIPFGYFRGNQIIKEYGVKYGLSFPVITAAIKRSVFSGFYVEEHASNDWLWAYLYADHLTFYGEERKLLTRGHHTTNDSNSLRTQMGTYLSLSYIYYQLSQQVDTKADSKLAANKSKSTFNYLIFLLDNKTVKKYAKSNMLYATYFKSIVNSSILLKLLFKLPNSLRRIIYKILRKLNFIK